VPLCYWSYDRPINSGRTGVWDEYIFDTNFFTDEAMNDAIADSHVPNMDAFDWSKFQFGIGIADGNQIGTFFLDDIEFVFESNSVKSVSASSAKIYSIPGGLAIEGVEKAVIYGIDGSVIATATGNIALPKGVYIVKAGSEVVKAIVK
jgi:hypothetical protein